MKHEYLSFTAEELALDPAFVAWVRHGADADAWSAWLDAHPERAETVAAARRLVGVVQFRREPVPGFDGNRLWSRIEQSTQASAPALRPRRRLRPLHYAMAAAAAAVLLLLVLSGRFFGESLDTAVGETLAHTLPDGSTVRLNAASEVRWRPGRWDEARIVRLEGEAYFEVEAGARFAVMTERGSVEVLGTTFNVYSRDDGFRVHCSSGRVQVTASRSDVVVVLAPGEACYLTPGGELEKVAATAEVDWLEGIRHFEDRPLDQVFAELERQFDVTVQADATVRELRYSGFFETRDLEAALYAVTWPMQLTYEVENKQVTIRAKNQ